MMARSRALDVYREGQAAGRAGERVQLLAEREEGRVEDRPEAAAVRSEEGAEVRRALDQLSLPQREALVLAYWGGLTADQIARRSHVPLGTVKSRIRLALTRLSEECGLPRTPSEGATTAARSAL
jgi:RNA polymerase sigma-70 factor (ECF subfamily)